jgi:hypothetical protein
MYTIKDIHFNDYLKSVFFILRRVAVIQKSTTNIVLYLHVLYTLNSMQCDIIGRKLPDPTAICVQK